LGLAHDFAIVSLGASPGRHSFGWVGFAAGNTKRLELNRQLPKKSRIGIQGNQQDELDSRSFHICCNRPRDFDFHCTQGVARGQSTGMASSTPPMGWNSWDSYGTTMNEAQVKAKADWMAKHLKASGDFACVLFQYRLSD
jgi:hypothetical protein